MSSLKKLAISGAIWTIASYGTSQALRLGGNLILTHLLAPELFGLMTLVNVFIIGLHLFSDIGLGPSIIQNKRGDEPEFLNTAWTLQILRSVVIWLCCLAIAFPLAQFYREPRILWLVPIVSLSTLIAGFNSTTLYTLNRDMAMRQLVVYELAGQIISLVVMVVWAWFSKTIWALVAGSLVATTIQMVWSHYLTAKPINRLAWERKAVGEIFSFGGWIFFSTALHFLAEQADRVILGKLIPLELLGVYGVAFMLSDLPRQVISALSSKVLFPALSKLADLPRETFRAKLLKNRQPILIAIACGLTVLVSFGDIVVSVLYNDQYAQACWMLPILALGIWPRVLTQTIDSSFFAIGKPRYVAYGSFFKFFFIAIGLPIGFSLMGILGAVIVVALNDIPFYGAIAYGLWREKLSSAMQDLRITILFLGLLTVVLLGRFLSGYGLPISQILSANII